MQGIPISFFVLSGLFALTHYIASGAALYWYYWWFDIFMHFWGGILIGLGVHTFVRLSSLPLRATTTTVFVAAIITVVAWEVFEYSYDLYNPDGYLTDTIIDIMLGLGGSILAHYLLKTWYITRT